MTRLWARNAKIQHIPSAIYLKTTLTLRYENKHVYDFWSITYDVINALKLQTSK